MSILNIPPSRGMQRKKENNLENVHLDIFTSLSLLWSNGKERTGSLSQLKWSCREELLLIFLVDLGNALHPEWQSKKVTLVYHSPSPK